MKGTAKEHEYTSLASDQYWHDHHKAIEGLKCHLGTGTRPKEGKGELSDRLFIISAFVSSQLYEDVPNELKGRIEDILTNPYKHKGKKYPVEIKYSSPAYAQTK